ICLTPTRYLWSGYSEYFKNSFFRRIVTPLIWLLRIYDKKVAADPHIFIAISQEVRKRIRKYYGRDSVILYPPLTKFPKIKENKLMMNDYFLVVSRLSRF